MSDPGPKLNQARQHFMAGRLEQARSILAGILQKSPGHADASSAMALVLTHMGRHDQALYHARRAARPDRPDLLINLGNALGIAGHTDEAIEVLLKAAEALPARPEPRLGLANLYRTRGEYSAAASHLRAALRHHPDDPALSAMLGAVLLNMGRAEESMAVCRAALAAHPADAPLASMLASASNYTADIEPADAFELHVRYGKLLAAAAPPRLPERPIDPSRPPRVGILSHDLRQHSVAYFLEPILRGRADLEIHCYHSCADEDAVSARLRPLASSWRNVAALKDPELAARIREDRIDILVETCGLTQGHRLAVLAARPAPVQCTFLGYPNTTGVPGVDYRIVDGITDPPGSETRATETLLHLDPCFVCYTPPADAPPPGPPPSAAAGSVTFGSFNAAPKFSPTVINLWARVLDAVPGSRLVLKAFDFRDAPLRAEVLDRLTQAGADPARIDLLPPTPGVAEHLALYSTIDIALDTYPYHGATTTLEALHMGVPVVTLAGRVHAARVGVSILRNVGLDELIAENPERYIEIARSLALDPPRLAALRGTLRQRLAASPLCDGPGYAARFAAAMLRIWRDRAPAPA